MIYDNCICCVFIVCLNKDKSLIEMSILVDDVQRICKSVGLHGMFTLGDRSQTGCMYAYNNKNKLVSIMFTSPIVSGPAIKKPFVVKKHVTIEREKYEFDTIFDLHRVLCTLLE